MGELTCLSGGAGSRGNAWLIASGDSRVLLDCGAAPDGDAEWLDQVDPTVTLISHAHWDHCAALGNLYQRQSSARVYATPETRSQLELVLEDALKGASQSARRDRATAIKDRVHALKFHEDLEIDDMVVRFVGAGHVPGAAMIRATVGESRILYTSDFCLGDQYSVAGAQDDQWDCDTLVIEGALAQKPAFKGDWRARSWQRILAAIEAGPTLLGVGPHGSALELARGLEHLGHTFKIHDALHRGMAGFEFSTNAECEHVLNTQGIVLAPSEGFAAGSPSANLILSRITDPKVQCVLLDARAGLGRVLANTPRRSKLRWSGREFGRVKARIHRVPWTNHASRAEILRAVEFSGAKRVVLTHNQADPLHHLRRAILRANEGIEVIVAEPGMTIPI